MNTGEKFAKGSSGALIDSPLFGLCQALSEYDAERLRRITQDSPLAVFQALNRALNARGMRIHVTKVEDEVAQ